ncbi:MAG: hypothetical protein Q8922_00400 [Bacteroidota bacterium]|nr:hypothetical protein [Bacteroidota bacterium]MDP4232493.1 hypothetical protein [Bacteroidota bacterium]MDP4241629.1 hypothetical protein [Bacteroidota bacterium]MDP4286373.1 hypothetical protein [Bacteroidota bacterium]
MRRLLFIGIFAAITAFGFDVAGLVDSFTARPDGDGITLDWRSEVESGVKNYTIERCDVRSANDFQEAGQVQPSGSYSSYRFHDGHLSIAPIAGQTGSAKPLADAYKYRIRINLTDGELSYSQTINVTKPSSGVRRTWGMIKEMFH